jgi:enoyl-[acyl-carrier protein] reductase I
MPGLMHGKRGLVMGVANDHSIAWGIARTLAAHDAKLAFTYQSDALGKRVKPLAASINADLVLPCDVEDIASVEAVFAELNRAWGGIDFLVHAIAFSDKSQLTGRYADTTRENFIRTMVISCFSFTEVARRAAALMPNGGAMLTLTYNGGLRAMPNYNAMGVAKAALEASVRYLAVDFGGQAIRVNAISSGPIRTLAGAIRRCIAASPWTSWAARRFISSPTSPPASPAKSISSIPATTSSPCRILTRCAPIATSRRTAARGSDVQRRERCAGANALRTASGLRAITVR